jgi:hypothetical protein
MSLWHSYHSLLQQRRQILAREAALGLGDLLRRAFGDDLAALDAALRPQVEDPVGGLDDVEIMLDHDDGVALLDERVEDFEEFADVLEMQAGGGLVEDVQRVAGRAAREFLGELDALRLAARERRRLLADLDVAETDLDQHRHLVADRGGPP